MDNANLPLGTEYETNAPWNAITVTFYYTISIPIYQMIFSTEILIDEIEIFPDQKMDILDYIGDFIKDKWNNIFKEESDAYYIVKNYNF